MPLPFPVTLFSGTSFSPISLFANGEQGVWFQNSDMSTLFQDAAGTTPVTGYEQFVGLRLDKSKGLALGPELVTNGNFSNGTTGWVLTGATSTVVNGQIEMITAAGSRPVISQDITTVVGKTYQITFQFQTVSGGVMDTRVLRADFSTSIINTNTGMGIFTALDTTTRVFIRNNNTTNGSGLTVDNISVRELPGNHLSQSTAAARPVLSARVNLLTRTEEFDNVAWTKFNTTVTADATTAPKATATADAVFETTATAGHSVYQTYTSPSGIAYTYSVNVKANGRNYVFVRALDGGVNAVVVDFVNKTATNVSGTTTNISCEEVANGFLRVSFGFTSNGTGGIECSVISSADGVYANRSYLGDVTKGFYIWGADLRVANESSALPAYQRVGAAVNGTSTSIGTPDYDTVGFPAYLRYDGGDWYQTNSIDFSTGATSAPTIGAELVTNGGFDADATWTKGVGWAISGGKASSDGSQTGASNLFQSTGVIDGKTYEVIFTVSGYSAGSLRPVVGGGGAGSYVYANGTYKQRVICSVGPNFFLQADADFVGSIDNVSVKEIDPLYATDRMSVFAGVRKLSDPGVAIIAELSGSAGANAGSFVLMNYNTGWLWRSRGSSDITGAFTTTTPSPATDVLVGFGNISGDRSILRENGLQVATDAGDQGTGAFGNHQLYIGARAGSANHFTGREYGLVIVGRGLTAAELSGGENWFEGQTFGKDMNYFYADELTTATGDLITAADGDQIYMTSTYS